MQNQGHRRSLPRPIALLVALLLLTGAVSRLAPLLDQDGRLLRQFPTEDGYLMLTIARNLALGRGMSIAGGSIPTNGTQPLATVLWAGAFTAAEGDRKAGVGLVLGLEFAIACLSAWLLFRLGRTVLGSDLRGLEASSLAAAVWWASPVVVRQSMNCLETGLYVALVLGFLLVLLRGREEGRSLVRWTFLGALLGLGFLARNDAVFLCLAVGATHLAGLVPAGPASWKDRLAELVAAAFAALAVGSPWLLYNLASFGNLVPVSGQAESLGSRFGENLATVPPALFEYTALLLPIPSAWESRVPVIAVAAAVVVAGLTLIVSRGIRRPHTRPLVAVAGLFALALVVFYGFFFRAPHFMTRYLFPASPFLALAWGCAAAALWHLPTGRSRLALRALAVAGVCGLALLLNARLYRKGHEHLHFQVVEWVERHVASQSWVGAIQTGTLGFFHDRTINLDGKVNPEALVARREQRVPQYVVDKGIEYLVDWVGIASWMKHPEIASHFIVVTEDPRRNLAVLRRITPVPSPVDTALGIETTPSPGTGKSLTPRADRPSSPAPRSPESFGPGIQHGS